ncbi:MAG TPA: sulfatase-like hydrolase/transferase, partial [Paraburkholderia sp.]|uniref:sulfatase family protein n=1 Tax=Paraburkholderia sp. TaxID=1926495 RepID=UPI002B4680E4
DYGSRDASFLLAHHVLGNGRHEACGDLCRILREYTNVRDTHIRQGVKLVDNMLPAQGEHPNVFIFVIDSMRADYLGAYNPQVDYTPNLDALAHDSIVFHRTYTQYAGTSISEPAIWVGAELLHTHFPQPFDELNSLRTLAKIDGYELVASYDTVLKQLFTPLDNLTKLDTDKDLWNRYEACSTISELESHIDSRTNSAKPVFFYAQPMNVHQFARNDVPSPTSQHWPDRPGLNTRITYEVHWVDSCIGGFVSYLKQRGLYDNSILVVTSDHGDATGELGRISHSTSIWPEIMRVPLIMHLPSEMRKQLVYDDGRLSTLTDIAPTLYYVLGHKPIRENRLYGRPLLAQTRQELDAYAPHDLLLASDVRAVYGILTDEGRYLYTTYDSPAQSYLFDLVNDPNAQHSILTPALKQRYDEEIIEHLQTVGDYYGYKPGVGSLLASSNH